MEHFFQNIYGWFDYQDLYSNVIKSLPDNSKIVEIGAYKGCSTSFLAVEIINSGKNIKLDVIDSWNGENETEAPWQSYVGAIDKPTGDIFEDFKKNLAPVFHIINPVQSLSTPAAALYEDKSLDFIFIDGDHNYEGINKDLHAWRPKMKDGAIMAGHDYNPHSFPGVIKAVDDFFGKQNVNVINGSWLVNL